MNYEIPSIILVRLSLVLYGLAIVAFYAYPQGAEKMAIAGLLVACALRMGSDYTTVRKFYPDPRRRVIWGVLKVILSRVLWLSIFMMCVAAIVTLCLEIPFKYSFFSGQVAAFLAPLLIRDGLRSRNRWRKAQELLERERAEFQPSIGHGSANSVLHMVTFILVFAALVFFLVW